MTQEQQQEPQQDTPALDAAARAFEAARRTREAVERKCLLGLVAWKER